MSVDFVQAPPALGNQHTDDRVLQSTLRRVLPSEVLADIEPELHEMGRLAGGKLYDLQLQDLDQEPTLTRWGAWGDRIDDIDVTDVWKEAERVAAEKGVVATAYEQRHGPLSRIHQMALAYLFIPSTDMYGCPLAMTDGAARTLLESGNGKLIEQAVPHLTSRNPDTLWTSGQWMTELAGGSDVGRSRTTARQDSNGTWRLSGRKWFTSAITANMALALARPEGNESGGAGLALFYVPIRENGRLREGITVNRLKDKLGTRKLPTAELDLDGAQAKPVRSLSHGTRQVAPMLNVTRTWNAVTACAYMRRGLALARDYAHKREAFGKPLIDHPLHQETLADLQAVFEGAFHLTFRVAELLGKAETDAASETESTLLRLLTPITKLTTAKQSVAVSSEIIEAFGGAGYVEDTGLPMLLRDTQVLPIWEGTTNVLSLDLLRALQKAGSMEVLQQEVHTCADAVETPRLKEALRPAQEALRDAGAWLKAHQNNPEALQAGGRRFARTLGDALELAYTARHGQWALQAEGDPRSAAAAERLAARDLNRMTTRNRPGALALARESSPPALHDRFAEDDTAASPETASPENAEAASSQR